MCRLLAVSSKQEFSISKHLKEFSMIAQNSREYQGHGWGCAYLENSEWKIYKNINPIWEDELSKFGKTKLLLAHARSAFRDEGIAVENNMPFEKADKIFIFNGELHGVKIKQQGRIGAEKIFNYILRFDKGNLLDALKKGTDIIDKRSSYIRAMNIIMSDKNMIYYYSVFNEDKDYFIMHIKQKNNCTIICSDPYQNEFDWDKINNKTCEEFQL